MTGVVLEPMTILPGTGGGKILHAIVMLHPEQPAGSGQTSPNRSTDAVLQSDR